MKTFESLIHKGIWRKKGEIIISVVVCLPPKQKSRECNSDRTQSDSQTPGIKGVLCSTHIFFFFFVTQHLSTTNFNGMSFRIAKCQFLTFDGGFYFFLEDRGLESMVSSEQFFSSIVLPQGCFLSAMFFILYTNAQG